MFYEQRTHGHFVACRIAGRKRLQFPAATIAIKFGISIRYIFAIHASPCEKLYRGIRYQRIRYPYIHIYVYTNRNEISVLIDRDSFEVADKC